MHFVSHHPIVVLVALILSILSARTTVNPKIGDFLDKPSLFYVSAAALLLFLFWGYLWPITYYYPRNQGVVGDNYLYMGSILLEPHYYVPHHLVYPWVPGQLVRAAIRIGALSSQNPHYLEQAFALSTFPAKIAMLLAIAGFFIVLRRTGFGKLEAVLATFLLSASWACWIWSHQSNALGVGLAMEIAASSLFLLWQRTRRDALLGALAASLALCIYSHIGTLFFVLGAWLTVSGLILADQADPLDLRIRRLGLFHIPLLLLAVPYYWLAGHYVGNFHPLPVFRRLADTPYYGDFAFRASQFAKNAKDNIVGSLMNITNYWEPRGAFDQVVICFQLIVLTSLIFSLSKVVLKLFYPSGIRNSVLFFAITSLAVFIGFFLRGAGSHYYAVAVVPNVIGLIFITLRPELYERSGFSYQRMRIMALIVGTVLYSTFSSWSVLEGTHLDDNEYYRVTSDISRRLQPSENAIYVHLYNFDYMNGAIQHYYQSKFNRVQWNADPSTWENPIRWSQECKRWRDAGTRVFIGDDVLQQLQKQGSNMSTTPIGPDIYQLAA